MIPIAFAEVKGYFSRMWTKSKYILHSVLGAHTLSFFHRYIVRIICTLGVNLTF